MSDKKVVINVNGTDLDELTVSKPPPPVKKNFVKDYQVLLAAILVSAALGLHAWWVARVGKPISFSMPLTFHQYPTEVKTVTVAVPSPPVVTQERAPWENRVVKEYSAKK